MSSYNAKATATHLTPTAQCTDDYNTKLCAEAFKMEVDTAQILSTVLSPSAFTIDHTDVLSILATSTHIALVFPAQSVLSQLPAPVIFLQLSPLTLT